MFFPVSYVVSSPPGTVIAPVLLCIIFISALARIPFVVPVFTVLSCFITVLATVRLSLFERPLIPMLSSRLWRRFLFHSIFLLLVGALPQLGVVLRPTLHFLKQSTVLRSAASWLRRSPAVALEALPGFGGWHKNMTQLSSMGSLRLSTCVVTFRIQCESLFFDLPSQDLPVFEAHRSVRLLCLSRCHVTYFLHIFGDRQVGIIPGFHPGSCVRTACSRYPLSKGCERPSRSPLSFVYGKSTLVASISILGLPRPSIARLSPVVVQPFIVCGGPTFLLLDLGAYVDRPACSIFSTVTDTSLSPVAGPNHTLCWGWQKVAHSIRWLYPRGYLRTTPERPNQLLSEPSLAS